MLGHGSLCVRGLLDERRVAMFVAGIDMALSVRGGRTWSGPDQAQGPVVVRGPAAAH